MCYSSEISGRIVEDIEPTLNRVDIAAGVIDGLRKLMAEIAFPRRETQEDVDRWAEELCAEEEEV